MTKQDWGAILLLSALWGGSFLFIRVAAPVFGPVLLMELRVLLAGLVLLVGTFLARAVPDVRACWRPILVVGIINSALPFVLISTAELQISASLAATLNATTPLFGALAAAVWLKDALTPGKIAGLLLGVVGVAVLVGLGPFPFSLGLWVSVGASLVAASSYGVAAVYTKARLSGVPPLAVTLYSQLFAALVLLPLVPFTWPKQAPTGAAIACMLALSLLSTALAYLLYFRLIARLGPTRATMVTYGSPLFGLLWGTVFLAEPLRPSMLLGLAMVMGSITLVSGGAPWRKAITPAAPNPAAPVGP